MTKKIKAYILSRKSTLYATKRLVEEGRSLGMKVRVLNTMRHGILVNKGMVLYYRNKALKKPDIIIPRIGTSITELGMSIMLQAEQMNIPIMNNNIALLNSRDKLRCAQILSSRKLPIPATVMIPSPNSALLNQVTPFQRNAVFKQYVKDFIEQIHGPPVIIKLTKGTQGKGVLLAETFEAAYAQIELMFVLKQKFVIQEFIKESKGIDIRVVVVGGQIVGAMKRESKTGDYRSNAHQGGVASVYDLSEHEKRIAIAATKAVGLEVAGVDMLLSEDGPRIIEVNSSPGFEAMEKSTKINVAKKIMEHCFTMINNKEALNEEFFLENVDNY